MQIQFINQLTMHRMNDMKVQLCSFLLRPLNPWRWRTTLAQWHSITSHKTSILHINLLYVTWMLDLISINTKIKSCWHTMSCDSHVTSCMRMNGRKKFTSPIIRVMGTVNLVFLPRNITLFQVFSFDFFLIIFSQWMTWMFFVVWVCVYTLHIMWNQHPPKKEKTDTTSVNSGCMCSTGSSLTNQEPMHVTISITITRINCWTTTTDLAYVICTTQW